MANFFINNYLLHVDISGSILFSDENQIILLN